MDNKLEVNSDCLLAISHCKPLAGISEPEIRLIFKQFGLSKIAVFEEDHEIVLEFQCKEDLELLDMHFDDCKVP